MGVRSIASFSIPQLYIIFWVDVLAVAFSLVEVLLVEAAFGGKKGKDSTPQQQSKFLAFPSSKYKGKKESTSGSPER